MEAGAWRTSVEGATTKQCCLALFHALFMVTPYKDLAIWTPTTKVEPGSPDYTEKVTDPLRKVPYYFDKDNKKSVWCNCSVCVFVASIDCCNFRNLCNSIKSVRCV